MLGLKGVKEKVFIKCIDMDGNFLCHLNSIHFQDSDLTAIGIGSTLSNMRGEMMKVFLNKEACEDFIKINNIVK